MAVRVLFQNNLKVTRFLKITCAVVVQQNTLRFVVDCKKGSIRIIGFILSDLEIHVKVMRGAEFRLSDGFSSGIKYRASVGTKKYIREKSMSFQPIGHEVKYADW